MTDVVTEKFIHGTAWILAYEVMPPEPDIIRVPVAGEKRHVTDVPHSPVVWFCELLEDSESAPRMRDV